MNIAKNTKSHDAVSDLTDWKAQCKEESEHYPLPPSVYTSDQIYSLEMGSIFDKEWICVGHVSEISAPGDYFTIDVVGRPLLITRDEAQGIHTFANVCRHRSSLLAEGKGHLTLLTCPYHAWTYELGGQLRAAPYMDKSQVEGVCLHEYRHEIWNGFILVNFDNKAEPLNPRLAKMNDVVDCYDIDKMQVLFAGDTELDCNWKVLVENFCESYHVFQVHKTSVEPSAKTRTTKVLPGSDGFNHHTMEYSSTSFIGGEVKNKNIPESLHDIGHLFCVYPCMTMALGPASAVVLSVLPLASGKLRYRAWCLRDMVNSTLDNEQLEEGIQNSIDILKEDGPVIEGVQKGLFAGTGNAAPLNKWEQTNWEFGQYLTRMILP